MKTFKIYSGMVLFTTTKAFDEYEARMIYKPIIEKKLGEEAAYKIRVIEVPEKKTPKKELVKKEEVKLYKITYVITDCFTGETMIDAINESKAKEIFNKTYKGHEILSMKVI